MEKSYTNASDVVLNPPMQAVWVPIWQSTVKKSQTNVTNALCQAQWKMGNRNIYWNEYLTPHFLDELLFQIKYIWRLSFVQFHFWFICGYQLNTAFCAGKFTNKSVAIQAGCMQDVFEVMGTSWMVHLKSWFQIFVQWFIEWNIW